MKRKEEEKEKKELLFWTALAAICQCCRRRITKRNSSRIENAKRSADQRKEMDDGSPSQKCRNFDCTE